MLSAEPETDAEPWPVVNIEISYREGKGGEAAHSSQHTHGLRTYLAKVALRSGRHQGTALHIGRQISFGLHARHVGSVKHLAHSGQVSDQITSHRFLLISNST
jgi:hypothetical protein